MALARTASEYMHVVEVGMRVRVRNLVNDNKYQKLMPRTDARTAMVIRKSCVRQSASAASASDLQPPAHYSLGSVGVAKKCCRQAATMANARRRTRANQRAVDIVYAVIMARPGNKASRFSD